MIIGRGRRPSARNHPRYAIVRDNPRHTPLFIAIQSRAITPIFPCNIYSLPSRAAYATIRHIPCTATALTPNINSITPHIHATHYAPLPPRSRQRGRRV